MTAVSETPSASGAEPPEDQTPSPRGRRRLAKLLRRVGIVVCAALALLVLAAVVLRWHYDDERLRQIVVESLHERTHGDVELASLELHLGSGLELHGMRIGPPPGFSKDVVRFDRFAFKWSLWDLLLLRAVVDELALEGLHLNIEENASGQNLARLAEGFAGTAGQHAAPEPKPEPSKEEKPQSAIEQPSLPIKVELRRLTLKDAKVAAYLPGLRAQVDSINVAGHVIGEGQTLDVDLWAGLGEPDGDGRSTLHVVRKDPPLALEVTQHFGVQLKATGLADLGVVVTLDNSTNVTAPLALPPLSIKSHIDFLADLLQQRASLREAHLQLGEGTVLEAVGAASQVLSADPQVSLQRLTATSNLDELSPLVEAVVPHAHVAGTVAVDVTPFSAKVSALKSAQLTTTATLTATDVKAELPQGRADQLDAKVTATLADGNAHIELAARVAKAAQAAQSADGVDLQLRADSPVAPFLGGTPQGAVDLNIALDVRKARTPEAQAGGLDVGVNARIPIPLLIEQPSDAPLSADVDLSLANAHAANATVSGLSLALRITSSDLTGAQARAEADLQLAKVALAQGEQTLSLPNIRVGLAAGRSGDTYDIERFSAQLADAATAEAHGKVAHATGPAPRVSAFSFVLRLPSLNAALQLLPEAQRPPLTVKGAFEAGAEVDGTVPHQELAALLTPPPVELASGRYSWAQVVQAYADYIQHMAERLRRGLPFSANLHLALDDVAVAGQGQAFSGLKLQTSFAILAHGPRWRMDMALAHVSEPVVAKDVSLQLDCGIESDTAHFDFGAAVGELSHAALVRPLEGAGINAKAQYRLGGDLVVEQVAMLAPDRGGELSLSGVLVRPLQAVANRSWEQPGMPGVDASLRFKAAFSQAEVEEVTHGGPAVGGGIGLDGKLRLEEGVLGLSGRFLAQHFSAALGEITVEEMNGGIPFDLRLAFGKRDDGPIVARDLPIGGGVLSLLASAQDIRKRPARPVYYDRLRAYRQQQGLSISSIRHGAYEVLDFRLDGRIDSGMLLADLISMNVLGGDIVGTMALQLAQDASLRGDIAFKTSGLDASHFKLLQLPGGPESELSADMQLAFLFAPHKRDISMAMNFSKIGSRTLDRFLQLMDPEGKDEKLQSDRKTLSQVYVREVSALMRYDNLYVDVAYTGKLFGVIPIPGSLKLPRFPLAERLNNALQPMIDANLAPALGWTDAP